MCIVRENHDRPFGMDTSRVAPQQIEPAESRLAIEFVL